MKKDICVSIIIPVYNGENYLRDAIDSALSQSYANCEVIVVNDGSTDNTDAICKSYVDRIRYFCKENGGVSSALNLGLQKMCGEYFTWLAHDDMFYAHKVECQIAALQQVIDKTTIVHSNYDLLNVSSRITSHIHQEESYTVEQLTNSVFPVLMTTIHASTPLIHKSHFERVGLFDEKLPLTQDYDFLFRAMRGQNTIFLQDSLLVSRLHKQSNKNVQHFNIAAAKQYEQFLNALTLDEISSMFPSPRAFYYRIAAMIYARNSNYDLTNLVSKLKSLPKENKRFDGSELHLFLKKASGGSLKKICIFCGGYYGKIIKCELEGRGIKVDYFCDNDENKHGKMIDSCICLSLKELEKIKKKTLIVIAGDTTEIILAQLLASDFHYVTTKTSLDSLILSCSPADTLKEFTI